MVSSQAGLSQRGVVKIPSLAWPDATVLKCGQEWHKDTHLLFQEEARARIEELHLSKMVDICYMEKTETGIRSP